MKTGLLRRHHLLLLVVPDVHAHAGNLDQVNMAETSHVQLLVWKVYTYRTAVTNSIRAGWKISTQSLISLPHTHVESGVFLLHALFCLAWLSNKDMFFWRILNFFRGILENRQTEIREDVEPISYWFGSVCACGRMSEGESNIIWQLLQNIRNFRLKNIIIVNFHLL